MMEVSLRRVLFFSFAEEIPLDPPITMIRSMRFVKAISMEPYKKHSQGCYYG